jgi:hypothetical protein
MGEVDEVLLAITAPEPSDGAGPEAGYRPSISAGEREGEAKLTLGDDAVEARPGAWVHMARGLRHSIRAKTPVVMLLLLLLK